MWLVYGVEREREREKIQNVPKSEGQIVKTFRIDLGQKVQHVHRGSVSCTQDQLLILTFD